MIHFKMFCNTIIICENFLKQICTATVLFRYVTAEFVIFPQQVNRTAHWFVKVTFGESYCVEKNSFSCGKQT